MSESVRTIAFPDEWAGTPIDSQVLTHPDKPGVVLFGCLLKDGSNLHALIYPGGHRFARVSPDTNWALEERLEGAPPSLADERTVTELWRTAIGVIVAAGRGVRVELAKNRDPWVCLSCAGPPRLKFVTADEDGPCPDCGGVLDRRDDV